MSQPILEKYLSKADINEAIKKLYPEDFNTKKQLTDAQLQSPPVSVRKV